MRDADIEPMTLEESAALTTRNRFTFRTSNKLYRTAQCCEGTIQHYLLVYHTEMQCTTLNHLEYSFANSCCTSPLLPSVVHFTVSHYSVPFFIDQLVLSIRLVTRTLTLSSFPCRDALFKALSLPNSAHLYVIPHPLYTLHSRFDDIISRILLQDKLGTALCTPLNI